MIEAAIQPVKYSATGLLLNCSIQIVPVSPKISQQMEFTPVPVSYYPHRNLLRKLAGY